MGQTLCPKEMNGNRHRWSTAKYVGPAISSRGYREMTGVSYYSQKITVAALRQTSDFQVSGLCFGGRRPHPQISAKAAG